MKSALLKKTLRGRIIFLVGMMGSGKSLTGPYLAKALDYSFIDQDNLIEEATQSSIREIFNKDGETAFRVIETKVLKEIGQLHSLVVATGGGVVTQPENWGVLHQGIVVWINPTLDCLLHRLTVDSDHRPLLDKENLNAFLPDLLKEREVFYKESDLEISVQQENPEEVSKKILAKLPTIFNN